MRRRDRGTGLMRTFVSLNREIQSVLSGIFASRWLHRLLRHRLAAVGGVMLVLVVLCAVFAPLLSGYSPTRGDFGDVDAAPSMKHPLGTDGNGRDDFSRLVHGGRVSLAVGIGSTVIAALIGTGLGAVSGYFGGVTDLIIQRFTELVMTFPWLLLIIVVVSFIGPSIFNVMMVMGLLGWPGFCRLVRGQVLVVREQPFVEAVRAMGANHGLILVRHVIPNILPHVIVAATLWLAGAILTEAALSFLGLGVQPPTPSWGSMLQAAQTVEVLVSKPWRWIAPGMAIALSVLAINFVGDGLRDAFDPKSNLI